MDGISETGLYAGGKRELDEASHLISAMLYFELPQTVPLLAGSTAAFSLTVAALVCHLMGNFLRPTLIRQF